MAPPPRHPRKPSAASDRAAVLHLNHQRRQPAPTLASTRAAWLRESWAKPSTPVSAAQQASWRREEAAWQQRLVAAQPSDRAAVQHLSGPEFATGVVPGTHRYYVVLFGRWNGLRLEVDTAYLLLRAHEVADSVAAWYEASHLVAEASVKIDAGIQGRVEGVLWGVKGKADINVVKADLFEIKANLREPFKADSYDVDYAGKDGKTKISNSLTVQAELPWLPSTPWGKLAVGGMAEQSQWIDANLASSGYAQDWGLYAIVPLLQPKGMKNMGEKLKVNPATQMAKGPSFSTKEGKQKDFYGLEVGLGAALLLGINGKVKIGLK